ncbi:hypothetical protein DNTS_011374 [Danionella cerebrum]|uniref:Cilia- and flagella-associated protein 157 n=1 Tax=Danionella cerebrum TaxID=2873325 RepID=A0A553QWV7_9TELE|nr:hypothetical protein DNTS_011374 [Danionella translucida]
MPPKKNGKSNAINPRTNVKMEPEQKKEEITESERSFYRTQIRDLEVRLERYQHKCDELEVHEKDLSCKINTLEREKKDIVLFLKRTLSQKEDELNEVAENLTRHQQAHEAERESFQSQLSLLRRELQESKEKYTSENMMLGKLSALEEFSTQREKLVAERKSLEEQLQMQKEQHQAQIYDLEKKAILDNDRLKKEMLQHVSAVAAEFRRVSDLKMPETTQRALQENLSLIQQIREKNKQMQSELENCAELKREHQELLDRHSATLTELQGLRQNLETVMEALKQSKAEGVTQSRELVEERLQSGQLKSILEEAASALHEALREAPEEEDSMLIVTVRRNQMIQKLLAVLDSAAHLEKNVQRSGGPLQSSYRSHFTTGDLGLVPRQTHSTSTKKDHLSRSAKISLEK